MKTLILYDSTFGNTEKVANAIAEGIGKSEDCKVTKIEDFSNEVLQGIDLLLIGSPTIAFNPSLNTKIFLKRMSGNSCSGIKAAAFDTRMNVQEVNSKFLIFMAKHFGYADRAIVRNLKRAGCEIIAPAEGFIVKGSEGPLKEGELDRARAWGGKLKSMIK